MSHSTFNGISRYYTGCTFEEANILEGGISRYRNSLLEELCWEDLKTRGHIHKLSLNFCCKFLHVLL